MRLIDADAFAEAIENLDWYSLHKGKMIQGAERSETAYYRASDIYTEINKAVTIRADLIEPKCGRWEERFVKGGSPFFWRRFYCSACGDWTTHGKSKFCPNCGAKMEASDD